MKNLMKMKATLAKGLLALTAAVNYMALTASTALASEASTEADVNPFHEVAKPIVDLIDSLFAPAMTIVVAVGTLYCVVLGVKFAKAEEPQEHEKAKNHLKNAIIGFVLIFILVVALKLSVGPLTTWMNAQ
jgi:phosphotransferase system  glucose/maltose/N-acetylglucosamine-specific IIC component